jgi:hypothetical protein
MLARSGAVFPAWRAESKGNRITESASALKGQAEGRCWVPKETWVRLHELDWLGSGATRATTGDAFRSGAPNRGAIVSLSQPPF